MSTPREAKEHKGKRVLDKKLGGGKSFDDKEQTQIFVLVLDECAPVRGSQRVLTVKGEEGRFGELA